eukprot:2614535-Pyramimonas_sp.AAC.1
MAPECGHVDIQSKWGMAQPGRGPQPTANGLGTSLGGRGLGTRAGMGAAAICTIHFGLSLIHI